MSGIPIYQFCRAFDNVRWSDVDQGYVSGGYAFEKITRWNQEVPVPEEIRQAVINGYFALNDNYPPKEDDFALIAREINDKYAVLAVANRQLDDGGRPTIGYKYFWLEKLRLSQYVDGIGTLIYWWSEHQLKFNMAELVDQSLPEIFYCDQEVQKRNFQEPWLQETWVRVKKLPSIPHTVIATKQEWKGLPEYIKLHYLALGLSFRAKYFNAWAWNVNKIASPETFLAIFYTTQEDIPSNIRKYQLSLIQENQITVPVQPKNPATPLPGKLPNQIPPAIEKQIKSCLAILANKLSPNKIQELLGYIRNYADADWSNCIDKTTLRNASSPHEIYPQLIYLIAPNEKLCQKWLLDIVNSLEIETRKASPFEDFRESVRSVLGVSENSNEPKLLEFQRVLLEASYNDPDVKQKLEDAIYSGISFLLEKLMNPDQRTDVQKINYLLIRSQTIWSKNFKIYAKLAAANILYEDDDNNKKYKSIIYFSQPVIEILEKIENTNHKNQYYRDYHALAQIFREIEQKDLSELFYRMSGNIANQIPQDVRSSLSNEVRSQIFAVSNQTMSGQVYPTQSIHNNNTGDGGAKAIFGFLFFLAGTIIFFTSIEHWPELIIPRILTYLICTITAIILTGNPFKIRNFNIQAALSFIYIFVAVAFLVGSIYTRPTETVSDICKDKVYWLQNYQTYSKCYLKADKGTKQQQLQYFLPDPNSRHKDAQLELIINNLDKNLDKISNEESFNNKITKLTQCKDGSPKEFGNCLRQKNINNPTPKPNDKTTEKQCSLDNWKNSQRCQVPLSLILLEQTGFRTLRLNQNQINTLTRYLLTQEIRDDAEFQARKEKVLNCLRDNQKNEILNECLQ